MVGFSSLVEQTLKLSTKIRKSQTKKFYNIGPRSPLNPKNLVEETLMKISSLEVTSIQALFALVASPEAETLLRGISDTSQNLETLELVSTIVFSPL